MWKILQAVVCIPFSVLVTRIVDTGDCVDKIAVDFNISVVCSVTK